MKVKPETTDSVVEQEEAGPSQQPEPYKGGVVCISDDD